MSGEYKPEKKEISEEDLNKYVNEALTEHFIRTQEDQLLSSMKEIYQKYPTDKNKSQWLLFSDYVIKRRKI